MRDDDALSSGEPDSAAMACGPGPISDPVSATGGGVHHALAAPVNPVLTDILAAWEEMAGPSAIPYLPRFPVERFRGWLAHMEMIEVDAGGQDFSYRLLGTWFPIISRGDYSGKRVSEIPSQGPESTIGRLYRETVAGGAPRAARLDYVGPLDFVGSVETLLMPYSTDGSRIDRLMGAIALSHVAAPPPDFRVPAWLPEIPEAGFSRR